MARERHARNCPAEGEASSNHEASSPHEQTAMRTQTAPSSLPVSRHTTASAQPQNTVVANMLPTLLAIQGAIVWMETKLPSLWCLHQSHKW